MNPHIGFAPISFTYFQCLGDLSCHGFEPEVEASAIIAFILGDRATSRIVPISLINGGTDICGTYHDTNFIGMLWESNPHTKLGLVTRCTQHLDQRTITPLKLFIPNAYRLTQVLDSNQPSNPSPQVALVAARPYTIPPSQLAI